eukprot:gnl/TRDRNA2_/TRDRNA2_152016_c8_seq1.p1 gnl/TRDRNA2_/TRDRNA2_152016_c8~~gnl/TRDRNA2_/TRDRNA2_152016_c8_seq1.p1  ORF type:complete len:166 (-),score=22.05 gnl/TRDRNA2_/TRDRNA2_152016_c8_seq1:135-581(-)
MFPVECTGFNLRFSNPTSEPPKPGEYPNTYVFPPIGTSCTGFDNQTVVVRMPDGYGLLRGNYTLEVDVTNPGYLGNGSNNEWSFITRIRNPGQVYRIVDANRTLPGFPLQELLPVRTDEDAATPRFSRSVRSLTLGAAALSLTGARER